MIETSLYAGQGNGFRQDEWPRTLRRGLLLSTDLGRKSGDQYESYADLANVFHSAPRQIMAISVSSQNKPAHCIPRPWSRQARACSSGRREWRWVQEPVLPGQARPGSRPAFFFD